MTTATTSARLQRTYSIVSWGLRILLAAAFIGAGAFKLSGHPAAVAEFDQVGLGQWFRYFTAVFEIAGAVLMLWPKGVFVGAVLLAAVCVGAFFAQIGALHGDVIHTIILAAVFGAFAWKYRGQLAAFGVNAPRR